MTGGDFIFRDFLVAAFDGDEVAGWQHFDVDDGQDAMVDFVVVDFARDLLFADFVDVLDDGFVGDG